MFDMRRRSALGNSIALNSTYFPFPGVRCHPNGLHPARGLSLACIYCYNQGRAHIWTVDWIHIACICICSHGCNGEKKSFCQDENKNLLHVWPQLSATCLFPALTLVFCRAGMLTHGNAFPSALQEMHHHSLWCCWRWWWWWKEGWFLFFFKQENVKITISLWLQSPVSVPAIRNVMFEEEMRWFENKLVVINAFASLLHPQHHAWNVGH